MPDDSDPAVHTPRQEGYRAAEAGKPLGENPHAPHLPEHREWLRGWVAGWYRATHPEDEVARD